MKAPRKFICPHQGHGIERQCRFKGSEKFSYKETKIFQKEHFFLTFKKNPKNVLDIIF